MRVLFAGTSSDVGKTTTVLGIMRALRNRGLRVQGYKAGPDYIDTAFHTFATDVPSRNLDTWMLSAETIKALLGRHAKDADIGIMEGVMGMYDGADVMSIEGSSAHLAKVTKTPLILIINGSGVALSAAAMVLGFKALDPEVNLAGVIVNKVGSEGHYNLIKQAVEHHVGVPCIGYLKKNEAIALKSRHLGLIPSVEVAELDEKINEVAAMVEDSIDLDFLMTLASQAEVYDYVEKVLPEKDVTLAVARDDAFHFYYQDNLDMLASLGCNLVYFSPLKDRDLPEADGLYIGGGFPEVFGQQLQDNTSMKSAIQRAAAQGMPIYAECGGLMYLTRYITTLDNETFQMCGIFDCGSVMTERLQRFGYVDVTLNADSVIGGQAETFKAHEFHRSKIIEEEPVKALRHYDVQKIRRQDNRTWHCGYQKQNCLGGYPHIHFYSNPKIAENFVDELRRYRRRK